MVKLRDCPTCEEMTDTRFETESDDGQQVRVAYCKECEIENGRWVGGVDAGDGSVGPR